MAQSLSLASQAGQNILNLHHCCTKYLWIALDMLLKCVNVFKEGIFPTRHLKLIFRGSLSHQEPSVVGMVTTVAKQPHLAERHAALKKNENTDYLE